jgi:hypothetical protein
MKKSMFSLGLGLALVFQLVTSVHAQGRIAGVPQDLLRAQRAALSRARDVVRDAERVYNRRIRDWDRVNRINGPQMAAVRQAIMERNRAMRQVAAIEGIFAQQNQDIVRAQQLVRVAAGPAVRQSPVRQTPVRQAPIVRPLHVAAAQRDRGFRPVPQASIPMSVVDPVRLQEQTEEYGRSRRQNDAALRILYRSSDPAVDSAAEEIIGQLNDQLRCESEVQPRIPTRWR